MTTNTMTVEGVRPLRGRIRVPGDKSISHRALLLAAVAEGRSVLHGLAGGDDVARTRSVIEHLGVRCREGIGMLRVQGGGWGGLTEPTAVLDCGNSGTAIRLLLGFLAGSSFHSVLTGDASIARRPMKRVVLPLEAMGARIDGRDGGEHTPLAVRGTALEGRRHELSVASAQVKSAILLAGLQAEGSTEVVEPARSRDHTERLLRSLGIDVPEGDGAVRVERADLPAFELEVPGDPSSAAFFVVGALVTPGSEVEIENVGLNPRRTAFVDVLRRMGGRIETETTGESGGEPLGVIRAEASELTATVVEGAEVPSLIDEIPVLAVAAAFAHGDTDFRDAAELRVKETDRIGAIEQELSQMGIRVETRVDGFTVQGGRPAAGRFKSHGDHRVAMAAAIGAGACPGDSQIQGWRAVASSYPEFEEHLALLTDGS